VVSHIRGRTEVKSLILFAPCIVTIITHIHKQVRAIYVKSQIVHIHEPSAINRHPLGDINTKEYKINTFSFVNWMY
jgi:hypothetical protein